MSIANKIALFALTVSILIFTTGCHSETFNKITFGAFNDETYVWESYQVTTNQTTGVIK